MLLRWSPESRQHSPLSFPTVLTARLRPTLFLNQSRFASNWKLSLQLNLNWQVTLSHWLSVNQRGFAQSFWTAVLNLNL